MNYASEQGVLNAQMNTELLRQQPSVLYRPRIFVDGTKWCALYGDNLQDGVAGFGDSPAEAMDEFNSNWHAKIKTTKAKGSEA